MRFIGRLSKLLWGLNLALLIAALSVVVVLVVPEWSGHPVSSTTTPPVDATDESAVEAPQALDPVDPKLILNRGLFGAGPDAVAGKPGKAETAASDRPKSEVRQELPLRLLGTVVDERAASYAVLENLATKAQDVYRVGDMIGEARIDSIEQNRIVVVSMGERRVLSIAVTARDAPTAVAASPAPAPEPVKVAADEVVRMTSTSERQINMAASPENRVRAAQFLSKLKLSPHATNGQAEGLRISGLGDSMMAQIAGFQDGDVIRAVNGHPVPNARKAAQALRTARDTGYAQIEFTRGQERKSLAFRTGSW